MEATHYFLPFTIKIAQDINTIAVQNRFGLVRKSRRWQKSRAHAMGSIPMV
jgi:hypothetical protein